jgi:hypothetical protein
MFILGFHFPADMGNNIPDEKVVEKLDNADVDTSGISEIKLISESREGQKEELSYTNKETFMFKALTHYAKTADTDYVIYTNRYQISELSKRLDSDDETMALCKKLDSMAQFKISVA